MTPELLPFLAPDSAEPHISVSLSWDWQEAVQLHSEPVGRDLLLMYYREDGYCYCQLDGGSRGPVAQTRYTPDFSEMHCVINTRDFSVPQDQVHQILRMLPIRQILLSRGILFLHAAQVLHQGRGILFSAPSGTGKTTQAKLWQQHRNAEIVCSDRTLLRETEGFWRTFGYPYDGSEPVGTNQTHPLGAVVLLRQARENKIERLHPARAIALLMEQSIIDTWDPQSRSRAVERLAALLDTIPVYRLSCRADREAVAVLEETLQKEGIIHG